MGKEAPPYPYGPNKLYTQSNFGLYGGARTRFGNNRAKSEFKTKTRRKWHPNVQHHKPYSEALDKKIPIKVTTRVMKTIDKVGGLDNYILGEKPARIKVLGPKGWLLRWQLLQSSAVQEKFKAEREAMGLSTEENEEIVELRKWWESRKASQATKQQKTRRFAMRNQRNDIWRYNHYGISSTVWVIKEHVNGSQKKIEQAIQTVDRLKRMILCRRFGVGVAYENFQLPLEAPESPNLRL